MATIGEEKECSRGCRLSIIYKGTDPEKIGSTGWFEIGTKIEHTYNRCNRLIKNKLKKVRQEDKLQSKLPF
jgi:hypothetical protein